MFQPAGALARVLDQPAGEQLWMESTLAKEGPPRPIRLAVRRGDGPIVPLPPSSSDTQ